MQRQKTSNSLTKTKKKYLTQSKVRIALFTNSYANHRIAQVIKEKYKIDTKLTPKELRSKYFGKNVISEISRLSRTLNLPYKQLWEGIMLNKSFHLNKNVPEKEKTIAYLSIEKELIVLFMERQARASYFFDTDYDEQSIMPNQVFFPTGDSKRDWTKLAKALNGAVDEDLLEQFIGTTSLPFDAETNKKIAVKIIDNRGIESFVVKNI